MAGPTDVHLELGGKSAMIVFDDVEDLAATVDWACVGIFSNSGQVCRYSRTRGFDKALSVCSCRM